MTKERLIRRLREGDKIRISTYDGRNKVVTVIRVQEIQSGFITRQRRWEVIADYPYWWPVPITGYADDKIDVETT